MIDLLSRRVGKGITQAELSKLSGVPQPVISSIESGKRPNPTIETLLSIAAALGCKVDDLIKTETPSVR